MTQISITFKNQQVLQDVSWEVKKGERVGLVGEWGNRRTAEGGSMVCAGERDRDTAAVTPFHAAAVYSNIGWAKHQAAIYSSTGLDAHICC
jgi:ABC-type lipopolysaccharide export system ATPase subunit